MLRLSFLAASPDFLQWPACLSPSQAGGHVLAAPRFFVSEKPLDQVEKRKCKPSSGPDDFRLSKALLQHVWIEWSMPMN